MLDCGADYTSFPNIGYGYGKLDAFQAVSKAMDSILLDSDSEEPQQQEPVVNGFLPPTQSIRGWDILAEKVQLAETFRANGGGKKEDSSDGSLHDLD